MIKHKRAIGCASVIWMAAGSVMVGCAADPIKAPGAGRADLLRIGDYPQIVASPDLHNWLVFSPATVTAGSKDEPMQVTVPVRSTYDKKGLSLQYRFLFLDERGLPQRADRGHRFIHLEPRLLAYLDGMAFDRGATDWRLEIRAAR